MLEESLGRANDHANFHAHSITFVETLLHIHYFAMS